jgi:CO/xanthine dehydrogenase FAD-binding subunit
MVAAPTTLQEALELLSKQPCTIVAGATDQYVRLRNREGVKPNLGEHVLYLSAIAELASCKQIGDTLEIGATATLTDLLKHPELPEVLRQAIRQIGGPGIRNIATLAGNIANASPAADGVCALVALRASVELRSLSSKRTMSVSDFILGVRKTALCADELIVKILVPIETWTFGRFVKVGGRKADAISKVSLSVLARTDQGIVSDLRIAFGASSPRIASDRSFEEGLVGTPLEALDEQRILSHYASLLSPIDDQRSDKQYRLDVAMNLLRTAIRDIREDTHA